jgi:hypothetical protein
VTNRLKRILERAQALTHQEKRRRDAREAGPWLASLSDEELDALYQKHWPQEYADERSKRAAR